MNLTEENIIGVKELNENENISLSDVVPVQKENETEIKKISLEKILLAVSKMTNEQKQILNSALSLIDDENISSEKTFSSEKINSQIETVTTSKVAEIVANAPEDFNTLKEMSDWISEHKDDATAMNTAILQNASDIETETSERKSADENLQNELNSKLLTKNFWSGDFGINGQTLTMLQFWKFLYNNFGSKGFLKIIWSNAHSFKVTDGTTTINLTSGDLLFSCLNPNNKWSDFSAEYKSVINGKIYFLQGTIAENVNSLSRNKITTVI